MAREALGNACTFLKRSQIDDALYRRSDGVVARLRRQDMVTKLSCNHPGALADAPETIVLDYRACQRLLELLGFQEADRVRFLRETWRHCQFLLHLDRTETLGDYLTIEAEAGSTSPHGYRRQALKFLKQLGLRAMEPEASPERSRRVDSSAEPAYTAPIVPSRSAFERDGAT